MGLMRLLLCELEKSKVEMIQRISFEMKEE